VLALLALWAADRRAKWMAGLGWTWGLLLVLIVVGPWAVAISVSTDAGFWTGALAGDIAPKLAGGHEGHAAPPGAHVLASPLLLFPFTVLLPAAAVHAWRRRSDPGVRFALCWLAPVWLVFELAPTKLPHYPMPLYGGLAWLCAAAVAEILPLWARVGGAALSAAAGLAIAAGSAAVAALYGGPASPPWGLLSAVLAIAAGAAGAFAVRPAWRNAALAAAGGLGVAAHMAITGGLVPSLSPLWVSAQAAALLRRADLDPRNGVTPGPVAVTGYTEPSLVFALGTQTELDAPDEAADALAAGQPVFVEQRRQAAFLAAARERQLRAETVGRVSGFDYSRREPVLLTLWRLKTQAGGSPP
jgi:4-amino-4-deoxy-L-arabinose transferase-like glycosyltransferase